MASLTSRAKDAVVGVLLFAASFAVTCADLPGQQAVVVAIDSTVRDSLATAWNDSDATQSERGYCLRVVSDTAMGLPVIHVVGFAPPDSLRDATPYSLAFWCPSGTVGLHTHPPATCQVTPAMMYGYVDRSTCKTGGDGAWLCWPSWPDVLHLTAIGDPIGFIQCSRHALVPYGPLHRRTP